MDYVKLRTHVIDHERFLEAGSAARDLWLWGMLWAGEHETDGALPLSAVQAAPWGATGKGNAKLAERLVLVGLWEKTEKGFQIARWAEQGNMTKAEIDGARQAARERMKKRRRSSEPPGDVRANERRTNVDVPTYTSPSTSGSGSTSAEREAGPPAWWDGACETAGLALGGSGVTDRPARWVQYSGAMFRKNWPTTQQHAASWLVTVIRGERADAKSRPSGTQVTKQPYDPEAPWLKAAGDE